MPDAPLPRISVVMPTRDRPARLARALASLNAQTFPKDAFEIVVVDDGSGPETTETLRRFEAGNDRPTFTVVRREVAGGPAIARNRGWRAARAPWVAFTDDDCEPTPGWLEALHSAAVGDPGSVVVGATIPNPAEAEQLDDFAHTLTMTKLGRWFETANILYPRAVLERVGGFDEQAFKGWGGEDTDLGWRALKSGARPVWAPEAVVHHAVTPLGPIGFLRTARRWDQTMLCFKRHVELRRELAWGVFRTREHGLLLLAVVAIGLPRLPRAVRVALTAPYVRRLYGGRRTPVLAPFRLALDIVEISACLRGAVRFRVLVL